jgi:hypothetical protein
MPGEPKPEHGMPPRWGSPPLLEEGGWEKTKSARKDGLSSVMALLPLREQVRAPSTLGSHIKSPLLAAANDQPMECIPPPCSQRAQSGEGNAMSLTPQRTWARVPSTLASNGVATLVDFPPHACKGHEVARGVCCQGRQWLHAPLLMVRGDWC